MGPGDSVTEPWQEKVCVATSFREAVDECSRRASWRARWAATRTRGTPKVLISQQPMDLFTPDKFSAPGHDQTRSWLQPGVLVRRIGDAV